MSHKEDLAVRIEIVEGPGDIRNCKVAFRCPKNWEELERLTDVTRHCNACDQTVFLCTTDAEISEAVRLDRCVAISPDSEFNYSWSGNFVGRIVEIYK